MQTVRVTEHAVQRYRERFGSKKPSHSIVQKILKIYNKSELVKDFYFGKWIKYGKDNGDVYNISNIFLVVRNGMIITIWRK